MTETPMTENVICLSEVEIIANYTRVQWAEGLILQLPATHEGRNGWLMNYGIKVEADAFRKAWMRENPNLERPSHWPPEQVDPDLISARQVIAGIWPHSSNYYLSGKYDTEPVLQAVLAGIKLGRGQAGLA